MYEKDGDKVEFVEYILDKFYLMHVINALGAADTATWLKQETSELPTI